MTTPEVEQIRRLIDGLRRDRSAHPYHGRQEYSELAREVIARCEDLLPRDPAAVRTLTRRTVERITAALLYMDDSSGIVGNDLHQAMALHAQACAAAPPDPKRLATWLAKLHFDGPGWPNIYLRDFAEALGETGRAELTRLVDERDTSSDPLDWTSICVRILREQLAEISGDVDRYVATLAETPYTAQFIKIVNALRDAGRPAEAEEWARKGLAVAGNPMDIRKLRATYVELLIERGATGDALAVSQETYYGHPTRANFADLKDTATRLGRWEVVRPTAIQHLRDMTSRQPAFVPELLDILVAEDDLDEAWRLAVSRPDQLHESHWQRLISIREHSHPGDVIEPYQRLIEQRLGMTNDKYRYNRAIKMLRLLRHAYTATGQQGAFAGYVGELRERHKRKTAFIAKLDSARL